MGVEDRDISNFTGAPVMLYEFSRRSVPTLTGAEVTSYWRYTSADRDFVLDGNTYIATAITDDGVRQSGDTTVDQLTITMPYTEAVPQMFVGSPPSDPIYCTLKHANAGETDSFLVWAGIVGVVSRQADNGGADDTAELTASVVCNTVGATMDRAGLRMCWARGCIHDLYGFGCRADPRKFVVTGAITSMDGVSIVVNETAGIGALTDGPITTAFIHSAGTGYAVGDTGTINGGGGDASYTVVSADTDGHVITFTRDALGTGYVPGTNVGTTTGGVQPGIGTGLTFDTTVTLTGGAPTFNGGFVEWITETGHAERLGVIGFDNVSGRITVLGITDRLSVGTTVHCFFGCDHTVPTCVSVFNNLTNNGGNEYMPDKNPFTGDSVF